MLNEGLIVNDTAALLKSQIVNEIRRLGPCTPDDLERAVFKALAGGGREDVDWEIEDNQAGYYAWLKSFDQLVGELVEDDYIIVNDKKELVPTESLPADQYSHLTYPSG